jgi:DMSO/TMAO reductase YedYZ molybdopterin-dependent catalytic subunit
MQTEQRTLPPGQERISGFPRFGARLDRRPPTVPDDPVIELGGLLTGRASVALAEIAALPRTEVRADLHCVSGWTATDLQWEGVSFATVYRRVLEPALPAAERATASHAVFVGMDGYRSIVRLDDVLEADVLLADHLDGRPLDGDHGAPLRLVSPSQYGFVSTKHLCRIEIHDHEPRQRYHPDPVAQAFLQLVKPHPRARVWNEERHRYLPAWVVRPVYRRLIATIRARRAQSSS